jgi:ankyrin repeat protein
MGVWLSVNVKLDELHQAASVGNTDEILRLWRKSGSTLDVEHKDDLEMTPLHWAALNGHGEACRVLVSTCSANADSRDYWGNTPLMRAAAKSRFQCVEVLLELGADITLRSYKDKAALDWAREEGHVEVAALLAEAERIPEIKSANKV